MSAVIDDAVGRASKSAAIALSGLVGQPLESHSRIVSVRDLPPEALTSAPVTAVFGVQNEDDSRFLVTLPIKSLTTVRELLAPGADEAAMPDEMIACEVGNICTSHFLNSLGDLIHRNLLPSPPEVAAPGKFEEDLDANDMVILTEFVAPSGLTFGGTLRFHPSDKLTAEIHKAGG